MSDSQRTDEHVEDWKWALEYPDDLDDVIEFARELERELATKDAEIETLQVRHAAMMLHAQTHADEYNALRGELAEARRELAERTQQVKLAQQGYDYMGACEDARHYKERAEQAEARAAAAYDLLREARLSLDPFVDTDLCQVIDAAMGERHEAGCVDSE